MPGPILVVSPHLDDAVLSIGGSIAAWTAAGQRVVIASVYTTGPALAEIAPAMRKFADYTTRRAEDLAACEVLGAEVRWLDQIERAFRTPYLKGWSFFSTPPDRSGFSTLGRVTHALEALAALDPELVLVPLGIGNHIDHVETLVAATDWLARADLAPRVRFYEDFYALSGTIRARHPVARARRWKRWQSPMVRARRLAIILRTIAATARGPSPDTFLAPRWCDRTWTVEASPISTSDEQRQLEAIACYASQTRAFGGFGGIARATRAAHAWWGRTLAVACAEPLWRAS